jgi:hypothetical protein
MTDPDTTGCPVLPAATQAAEAAGPTFASPRLFREWQTVAAMVGCYCHDHHATRAALCPDCQTLLDYATLRLERCRFGAAKPACVKCPVHCYQPARREEIRVVMRYAGPRMLWRHPLISIRHWMDLRLGAKAG